jgi:hypothetical protein
VGRGVAWFLPVESVHFVELDVLPVQLINESRLEVDELIHFLQNNHMYPIQPFSVKYEVFTGVNIEVMVFWDMPCTFVLGEQLKAGPSPRLKLACANCRLSRDCSATIGPPHNALY